MTNLERVYEAAVKAQGAIEIMVKENEQMRNDIFAKETEDLREAKQKFAGVFKCVKMLGRNKLEFSTGVFYKDKGISIILDVIGGNVITLRLGNQDEISLPSMAWLYNYSKEEYLIAKLFALKADEIYEKVEKELITMMTEKIDNDFIETARENDKLKAQWKFVIMDNDPFYVDKWYDEDLICAMENANVPVTKENLEKMRKRAKAFFEDKSYVNECLFMMALDLD